MMLSIENMSQSEVEMAIEWAAQEGWNPGISDAASFRVADPRGFFIAKMGNQAVAVMSAVQYGEQFGFIGLYIAHPDFRGRGFGWDIWQAGMRHLHGRVIGLDGVLAQQSNYQKSGFQLSHRNIRFEGRSREDGLESDFSYASTVPLDQIPLSKIQAFDRSFFPEDRSFFISQWIRQPGSYALGLIEEGEISGYGVIRPCRIGFKIGPLFANSEFVAEKLYASLCARLANNTPVFLDVPECNAGALALVRRHHMQPMFETARMYTASIGDVRLGDTYGMTTFELG
jgi:ribosomal protein S18 acetylase RimI-like enzyme